MNNHSITLRQAEPSDERLLYRWVNDEAVRSNSFTVKKINKKGHHEWFKNKLKNPCITKIYIILNTNAVAVGQVRFDLVNTSWEIDFSIDIAFRGQGLATNALRLGIEEVCISAHAVSFVGRVKKDNYHSQTVFQKLGFDLEVLDNCYLYSLEISSGWSVV